MCLVVRAHFTCQKAAQILADDCGKRGLPVDEFISRLLVLYEHCINDLYTRDFSQALINADWAMAREIIYAVQSLDYHGPRAERFYTIFCRSVDQMPDHPVEKWHLYEFLRDARKNNGFLTVKES